ncbi:hypothetical protein TWF102_000277 [Orbilia oligospora]|uniref:F-box domain-containing protein n=1 Tax=Orbilia oligospora TaxID=2813651 RepID=A0A7C8N8Q4_ORBOL|nr:hypothetical protein TWF102_000277 [Orbilia oligospora]KAF3116026.1 hypothetical protein TWF103_010251 [Orbilia oligospora]
MSSPIERMPLELWFEVFDYLEPYQIFGIRRVSSTFYNNTSTRLHAALCCSLYGLTPDLWLYICEHLDYISIKAVMFSTNVFELLLTRKRTPRLDSLLFREKPPSTWEEHTEQMNDFNRNIVMHPIFTDFPLDDLIYYHRATPEEKKDFGRTRIGPWFSKSVDENASSPPLLKLRLVCWTTSTETPHAEPHIIHTCIVNFDVSDTCESILVSDIFKAFSRALCEPALVEDWHGNQEQVAVYHHSIKEHPHYAYMLSRFSIRKPKFFGSESTWIEIMPNYHYI